eukprot:12911355-Prorocentrum_lima.AAC.1
MGEFTNTDVNHEQFLISSEQTVSTRLWPKGGSPRVISPPCSGVSEFRNQSGELGWFVQQPKLRGSVWWPSR